MDRANPNVAGPPQYAYYFPTSLKPQNPLIGRGVIALLTNLNSLNNAFSSFVERTSGRLKRLEGDSVKLLKLLRRERVGFVDLVKKYVS